MRASAALLMMAAAGTAVAEPTSAGISGGVEVGATAAGESSNEMRAAAGALRLAGEVGGEVLDSGHRVTTGAVVRAGNGTLGPLQASHWFAFRYDLGETLRRRRGPDDMISWVDAIHRFDYEARAGLDRRRDLPTARYTGGELLLDSELVGGGSATDGFTVAAFAWGTSYVDAADGEGLDVMYRMKLSFIRWWDDTDGDGVPFTRDFFVMDSYLSDHQRSAVADNIAFYQERDRPLIGPLRADWRAGLVSSAGTTEVDGVVFMNTRHPDVTAGLLDGALRAQLGPVLAEVRYDRGMWLTLDAILALEDRGTARVTVARDTWSLSADAFTARTRLWRARHQPGEVHDTDGVAARASVQYRGIVADAAVELGHSFYAAPDRTTDAPAAGWRATLDLSRRWGSPRAPTGRAR
jgi:hypothetical protein